MAEIADTQERLPQSPRPEENMRVLPPESAVAPTTPLTPSPTQAPQQEQIDLGQVEQILQIAMSQEFLQGFPQNVSMEIQRLAKSINMILLREDIPATEKNRVLSELLPSLLQLMETREGPQEAGA